MYYGSDPSSYITYYVSVYNRSERNQVYIGPFGLTGEGLYDNSLITYELGGLVPYETVLLPGKNYSFTIKFKYAGNDTSKNTLTSKINFRFMEKPELAITNEGEITGIYPGYTPQEYEFKVSNYNGETINNVALSYGLTAEIQKPFIAKIYDANGAEVTSSIAIDVAGKDEETGVVTKVDHTYKLKIIWDGTNEEDGIPYTSAEYAGQTYTAKINLVATPKPNADGDKKYANYTLTQEKDITVKTAPLYITAEPNNTTIEMTNNRAEINLAVSNNDGSEYNPYETKYTISQDNTKYTLYVDEVEYSNNITGERTIGTEEKITLVEKIWLVPKTGVELTGEETANITITITSPYTNKTETKEIKITDTTGPTAPTITGGSDSFTTAQTISVSKVATDVGTGVQNYEYLVNNTGEAIADATGNVGSTETETSKTFDTDYNGYYIWFRAVDKVGNKGEWSNSQQLNIETTAPTITLGTNENTTWSKEGSVTVKLKDATSGLATGASIKYGWSTSLDTEPDSYTVATLPTYTDGTTTEVTFTAEASGLTGKYYLWVVPTTLADKAGNSQTATAKSTGQFYFDNKGPGAPTITGGSTSWAISRTISVSTAAVDEHVGRVASYEYYLGSTSTAPTASTAATGTASTTTTSQTFTTERNGYYVYFRGVDSLGNKGTWSSAQRLYIESTKPTITIKTNSNTTWAQTGSVTVALKDTTSGLASGASVKYGWSTSLDTAPSGYTTATIPTYTEGTTSEVTFTASASGLTGKYYLWVVPTTLADKAGNSQTATVKSTGQFYFDNQGPSAPTITGGSTTYATSRTISVSTASTDSHVGTVSKYEYYYSSSSTAPTASTAATGTVSTTTTSQKFASNMKAYYVYFRGVDSLGNKGTWSSAQRLYIDVNSPTVSAKNSSVTITAGDNVAMSTYFTTSANGNAAISSTVYKIGSASYTNTSSLAAGTYTVTCTVTKVGGKTASASMTLVVEAQVVLPTTKTYLVKGTYIPGNYTFTIPEGVNIIEVYTSALAIDDVTDAWVDNVNSGKSWASAFSENDMYEGEDTRYVKVTPGKTYTINFDYSGGGDGYAHVAYSQSINQKTPDIIDL